MHLHAMFQLAHHHCLTAPWMVVVACCCRRRRRAAVVVGLVKRRTEPQCIYHPVPTVRELASTASRGEARHEAAAVLHARVRHKHIFKCMQSSAASALMCSVGVNNVEEEERLLRLRLLASSLETRSSTCEGARARPSSSFEAAARRLS